MEFEWDENKAKNNLQKHGIDFEDAIGVFEGAVLEIRSDRDGEERYEAIGVLNGREIVVVYTPRPGRYRIISARKATKHERITYHQAHPPG
ncbi:MAG TPA: BrnT family toxin [Longimicrobiaceae bacterium]|nr:BrnT family toxin [Longimicrobiaceae bacterium]